MRLPAANQLRIKNFSGGSITELSSGITNGVVQTVGDVPYITQRPGIDIWDDASDQSAGAAGRGIFYWADNMTTYLFNAGTIYKGTQATSISTSPTTGTKRVYWIPIGGKIIMLNPESDEAFSITDAGHGDGNHGYQLPAEANHCYRSCGRWCVSERCAVCLG